MASQEENKTDIYISEADVKLLKRDGYVPIFQDPETRVLDKKVDPLTLLTVYSVQVFDCNKWYDGQRLRYCVTDEHVEAEVQRIVTLTKYKSDDPPSPCIKLAFLRSLNANHLANLGVVLRKCNCVSATAWCNVVACGAM